MDALALHAQTLRAQGDLLRRFLARHIQNLAALRHFGNGLQQQGGLADAGVAAEQNHRAVHQAAAEHAVQLAHAGGLARHFHRAHARQIHHLRAVRRPRLETRIFRLGRGDVFLQGIPFAAMRAFALPFGHGAAAFGAAVEGFWGFGHGGGFLVFWVSGCLGAGG
jgi:hypothetical protein